MILRVGPVSLSQETTPPANSSFDNDSLTLAGRLSATRLTFAVMALRDKQGWEV
jgi:hypothetical protein